MLKKTVTHGTAVLRTIVENALQRLLREGKPGDPLFTQEDEDNLANELAATLAAADLLGRFSIHQRLKQIKSRSNFSEFFADMPTDFSLFDDKEVEPKDPAETFKWFTAVLGLAFLVSPFKWARKISGLATTIASNTLRVLTGKVNDVIAGLNISAGAKPTATTRAGSAGSAGAGARSTTASSAGAGAGAGGSDLLAPSQPVDNIRIDESAYDIVGKVPKRVADAGKPKDVVDSIMDAIGISPSNPTYAETVFQTNAHDAYQAGDQDERNYEPMSEEFPAWQWITTMDGRQRPAHGARHTNYYPNSLSFFDVRDANGYDGYNCRCVTRAVHQSEWRELQESGAFFSYYAEKFCGGKGSHRPGPCPENAPSEGKTPMPENLTDLHAKAEPIAQKRIEQFKKAYAKISNTPAGKVVNHAAGFFKDKTAKMYQALEKRYGRKTAMACLASGQVIGWATTAVSQATLGYPLVIPGLSIVATLPAVAMAELYLQLRGKHDEVDMDDNDVDMDQVHRIAKEMVEQLKESLHTYIGANKFNDLNVPSVRQRTAYTCGPAAVEAVAKYYDIDCDETMIAKLAGTTEEAGTSPDQVIDVCRKIGLQVYGVNGMTVPQLQRKLILGFPVIACLQAWGTEQEIDSNEAGHWVVFTGWNAMGAILEDPATNVGQRMLMPWPELSRRWRDVDAKGNEYKRFGVVVYGSEK